MGLDVVELMMEVEDRFKVTLRDSECSRVRTVGDLAALVVASLPRTPSSACPTARRFFQLREHVVTVTGLPSRGVRPTTRLEVVFPKSARRRVWSVLSSHDRILPMLVAPSAVNRAMLCVTCVGIAAWLMGIAATWGAAGGLVAVSSALVAAILCGGGLVFVYSRVATCFPAGCDTMADLVRMTLPRELPGGHGERVAAEQTVLREVRELTAEVSGQPLEKVQPESRFYEDLQMG